MLFRKMNDGSLILLPHCYDPLIHCSHKNLLSSMTGLAVFMGNSFTYFDLQRDC